MPRVRQQSRGRLDAQKLLRKQNEFRLNCETGLTHVSSGVKTAFLTDLGRDTALLQLFG